MAAQLGGQPVYILPEGAQRYFGKDARRMNIMAAKVVAEAIKSTLGPRGMDKMLVDTTGDVIITNDGATILKEVEIKHPAAKMMVEIAKTQENEAGDGTTTSVILAGELLKRAEELLDQEVHATVIAQGYRLAEEKAIEVLNEMAKKVEPTDEKTLKNIAMTSLNSKATGITAKEHIADMATESVKLVVEKAGESRKVEKDYIKIQKQVGESTRDSQVIRGIVLDKEKAHPGMPNLIEKARIALLNVEIKIKKTETEAKFDITSPEQLQSFLDEEEKTLKQMVGYVVKAGANVVFCQKDIEDIAQYFLSKASVMAVKNVSEKDIKLLAKATGGNIVTSLKDMASKDLGHAERVEERKVGGKEFIFIEGCSKPKAVTLFVRGGTDHVLDEVERSLDDVISVVKDVIEDGAILPGGGASAMCVARRLREYANEVSGREQLAISEFANALEVIPKTLAENAGLDPIDALIGLRAEHEKGKTSSGIDLATGKPEDLYKQNVVETLRVMQQAIK
ncbi:MAG: TCP-1/cpn60 chaperonin family protein, partial [Euryarchaeota archaeon]|nr:TCP-1/cpn60 chaperonin family protein [Euryarchaeota archaeon]